jgi:hypothetical protein
MDDAYQPSQEPRSPKTPSNNDAITEQIRELELFDLRTVDDDRIYQKVLQLMASYGGRQIGLNPANRFYRVRKNFNERLRNNKGLEWYPPLFTQLRLTWYPQPESCTTRGRVNRVGESVFYCANSIDTAVLEMKPKIGEYLTILECAFVNENAEPNIFESGIHEGPGRFNPNYGASPPDEDHKYQGFLNQQGITEQTRLIRSFLVRQFMKVVEVGSEHEYKITNAIANVLLKEFAFIRKTDFMPVELKADGIAYASIAAEAKGANIAFTCEAADRLLRPRKRFWLLRERMESRGSCR